MDSVGLKDASVSDASLANDSFAASAVADDGGATIDEVGDIFSSSVCSCPDAGAITVFFGSACSEISPVNGLLLVSMLPRLSQI